MSATAASLLILLGIVVACGAVFCVYYFTRPPERRAELDANWAAMSQETKDRDRQKALRKGKLIEKKAISRVGVRSEVGGLACPQCGGTQFKAKRSKGAKIAAGLLAPKRRVRCETCGTEYLRR